MKHLLITVSAVVLLVGCGNSQEAITTAKEGSSQSTKTPSVEFYEAAESDNLEVLSQNINDGVDIDAAKGRDGETALHRAATRGKLEAAKLLIEKGADPNIGRAKDGYTALDLANQRGQTKIADLLRKHDGKTREELKAEGK